MPKESTNEPDKGEKESPRTENWAKDQQDRGYYYDDAHGYEKYDPGSEEDDEEEEPQKGDSV